MRPVKRGHLVLVGQEPLARVDDALLVVPTLNAITERTLRVMPCLVTHCSATSASFMARVRLPDLPEEGGDERAVPGHTPERGAVRHSFLRK